MQKRVPQVQMAAPKEDRKSSSAAYVYEPSVLTSSLRRRPDSPLPSSDNASSEKKETDFAQKERKALAQKLSAFRETFVEKFHNDSTVTDLMQTMYSLLPAIEANGEKYSPVGRLTKIQDALDRLHHEPKSLLQTDQLMVPTLGSQEGAFENVRMNYSGDQGQTIRQLINAHMVRRVVMCCLSSGPSGKRQHLAVAHEKGKITVLQLSALLKQADSSQKKLTLTRLSSAPIPFTVLSILSNPVNEDYLAVTGLKDCHVLTFSSSGTVSDHLVLHPQLDANNFIIKTIWMPGSQTELALVTADFVKFYDLAKDVLSPQYYFLVPSGKVRDCTLAFMEDGTKYLLLMSSAGHIYYQSLSDESSAQHGPFYVTSIMDVNHAELKDTAEQIGGGGVSIFYCHTLQLLFFSYVHGKSFMAPLKTISDELKDVFKIEVKTPIPGTGSGPSNKGGTSQTQHQALVQWGEIANHPGLITAFLQISNNPVVMMISPENISVQEIKVGSKAKIVDSVAIRHGGGSPSSSSSNRSSVVAANQEQRTTLILLCEDGSLKIYMGGGESTSFWISKNMHTMSSMIQMKPPRKKKMQKVAQRPSCNVTLPVDFFENCSPINDVEFGGDDLLQVYNVQQIKARLHTSGLYIANTKPAGFTLDVTNNDVNLVMVGFRVMLGSQDATRVPSYVEVFGRSVATNVTRSRWFDIPLTREESLQADKKFSITFGPSLDPGGIGLVDSVQMYGKTKEAFAWPEEDDYSGANGGAAVSSSQPGASGVCGSKDQDGGDSNSVPMTLVEKLVLGMLDIVNGYFRLSTLTPTPPVEAANIKNMATELMSSLVIVPTSKDIDKCCKGILSLLFPTKQAYYLFKDQIVLRNVTHDLDKYEKEPKSVGVENFHRLVLTCRTIAASRPQNLVKYAETRQLDPTAKVQPPQEPEQRQKFLVKLCTWFWQLLSCQPVNALAGTLGQPGITHIEATVQAIIEIFHAFTSVDQELVPFATQLYSQFLIADNAQVCFAAKQALIRSLRPRIRRRRVFIPSPPTCSSPPPPPNVTAPTSGSAAAGAVAQVQQDFQDMFPPAAGRGHGDHRAGINIGPRGIPLGGIAGNLEALLPLAAGGDDEHGVGGGAPNLPSMLEALAGDVDDEAMVELAIALSLQEQQGDHQLHDNLQQGLLGLQEGLEQLVNLGPELQHLPALQGLAGMLGGAIANANNEHGDPRMIPAIEEEEAAAAVPAVMDAEDVAAAVAGAVGGAAAAAIRQESNNFSDTTASAPASDDEGSTAAMDGSALRSPPAEPDQGSGAGSESGASVIESIAGEQTISGRSSAYEADAGAGGISGDGRKVAAVGAVPGSSGGSFNLQTEEECEFESNNIKLHALRLMILDQLLSYTPKLRDVGGVRSIPFMQVILMLTTDLDANEDKDKAILDKLLTTLIAELKVGENSSDGQVSRVDDDCCSRRSNLREMQLVIMRLFSVLMSRSKSWQGKQGTANSDSNFVSHATASALIKSGCIDHNLDILRNLLGFWKSKVIEDNSAKVGSSMLKAQPLQNPPDMSPFFLKQYVRGHAHDVFEAYPQLLTEMALRLPYQVRKISEALQEKVQFNGNWYFYLCEYMMTQQTPYVRRQVRKLLLYICGTKEKYRELRDLHSLGSHIKSIRKIISLENAAKEDLHHHHQQQQQQQQSGKKALINFPYDTLLQLIEHLKACVDIATSRTQNWQKYCLQDEAVLSFLLHVSFVLDDGLNPIVLQLLQSALCVMAPPFLQQQPASSASSASPVVAAVAAGGGARQFKFGFPDNISPTKSKSPPMVEAVDGHEESMSVSLVRALLKDVTSDTLSRFVEKFLLDCNSTSVRWQAHSLVVTLMNNSPPREQEQLVDVLWDLWHQLPQHGRKGAQFVDVLGYFSMRSIRDETKFAAYVQEAVAILRTQNIVLANHPNSSIYSSLSHLVDFNGYYLESDPCLVCNNPEIPYSSLKLSTLKVDTKYTTATHIVKLSGSHSISKISLRIGDLKRQKMVRTINIYYNNRSVQAVIELKNKPTMWHRAKKVSLTAGQTDIKIEFPLPIVACNLMIEYADFYENIQASSETLQCPRCSASVPANPGVCSNCGENVFQCHKCRSINYDEKDPFLCNTCGFCKYAKFEYTLSCRPCCAVDPIESEEDRKKAISSINTLLDKADKVYKMLIGNKPHLEALLTKISESGLDVDVTNVSGPGGMSGTGSYVNGHIQQLAQKYCGDCKGSFEELSKIIQKVMATRKELLNFDNSRRAVSTAPPQQASSSTSDLTVMRNSGKCYGCAAASVEHCLTLLRALATKHKTRSLLCQEGLIQQLLEHNLRRGSVSVRTEVRKLITFLTKDNSEATEQLNKLLYKKITLALRGPTAYTDLVESVRHEMALLAYTVQKEDACWEERLRCVMKLFLLSTKPEKTSPTVMECVTLPCLKILQGLVRPTVKFRKGKDNKANDALLQVESTSGISLDVIKWLGKDQAHGFASWEERAPRPKVDVMATALAAAGGNKKEKKEETRRLFLVQKYFQRWYHNVFRQKDTVPLQILSSSWLKWVLFVPTSRSARQAACSMMEQMSVNHERKKCIIDLLTTFLDELGEAGETASDFCTLYQRLIITDQWKYYLAVKGTLDKIASLITKEIEKLNRLEATTLGSDLAQGYALKTLTDIFATFVSMDRIKNAYKSRLVSTVLHGYLSLRRLVVQRTKLVDQTQEKLLELLEDMTTGTVEETKAFMAVCVETIQRYPVDDQLTPVFIFERLCNIIYPEETDTGEFFMTLEKDPNQEDFLQGRMLGNPYSSNDSDLGPLMREIKNKICRDCELIALLEDDNGMELLVNNKIISLDLPVKDVYQKVWLPNAHEGEPMRIIYRMRGLLGDATEEFIETLDNKDSADLDEEDVYKLANVMADCGGLDVMLARLESVHETLYSKQLLSVLLKLFGHCIRVSPILLEALCNDLIS
jgi:E3 ubiquitin-protein ligase UBR4